METLQTIWNLFAFLSLLAVPQLLGVLVYFRIRKHHDFLAHLAGFLLPPIIFFYLSGLIIISSPMREAESHGERICGTFIGMMSLMILFLTGVEIVSGLIVQIVLHGRHRTNSIVKQV